MEKRELKLSEIVNSFNLQVECGQSCLDRNIEGGYVSDLLSDVIANAEKDSVWVTLQIHKNIVGVAALKELAGIIIVNGRKPEKETIEKAEEEDIPIMVTKLPAFEIIGKLYRMLSKC